MTKQYETTLIVTPVLTDDKVKEAIKTHVDFLKSSDLEIVAEDYWGMRQLAYPIRKKTTGFYYLVEFKTEDPTLVDRFELNLKRDENILRFLTVKLDKYAIDYNEKKRAGLIGKNKKKDKQEGEAQEAEKTEAKA